MRRRFGGAVAGLLLVWFGPAAAQGPAPAFVPRQESADSLPAHPGRDETFGYCSACHAYRLVANQGMSRQRWDETLVWMTERHNLPHLDGDDRALILDYLAAAHPETRPRGGFRNPFTPP